MNKLVLPFCLLLTTLSSFAQIRKGFGDLSPMEIEMKSCPFDSAAPAVILVDEGSSDYNNEYNLISQNHQRIKVLKKDGIEYGSIKVRYYSENEFEYLRDIDAFTVNFDDQGRRKESRVDNKSIFFKKINSNVSEMSFAFPDVQVGSILEYRFTSIMKSYAGLRDWWFQSKLPVCVSSYLFKPAPNLEVTYEVQKKEDYPITINHDKSAGAIFLEMKNLPGLDFEPYMDAREDYVQKIRFQITKISGMVGAINYMSSWNEVARELMSNPYFGNQLRVSLPDEQKALVLSMSALPDIEKMKLAYHYMQHNYKHDGFIGIYADPGLKALYNKKAGSSASINIALVNLLKEAKLDAWPMIVSERGHGKINLKTPFLKQFNNTYAAVTIGDQTYYLDATNQVTPPLIVPSDVLNTTALILKKNQGIIVELKEEKFKYIDNFFINSILQEDGQLSGRVQLNSQHYAKIDRLGSYTADDKKFVQNTLLGNLGNVEVDSITVSNQLVDSLALDQAFNYKTGVQQTGDYFFLSMNMFSGFETNPFLNAERFSNINFGSKKFVMINNLVQLPRNFDVEELPKNLRMSNADKTMNFTRELFYSAETGVLSARIKIDMTKSLYTVDEYSDLREFYKKMIGLLNEQVVIKKKQI